MPDLLGRTSNDSEFYAGSNELFRTQIQCVLFWQIDLMPLLKETSPVWDVNFCGDKRSFFPSVSEFKKCRRFSSEKILMHFLQILIRIKTTKLFIANYAYILTFQIKLAGKRRQKFLMERNRKCNFAKKHSIRLINSLHFFP